MPSFERGGAYEPSEDVRVFDASGDDEQEDEGSRLPLLIVIGLLVFAAFSGVVWLAYTQGVARGRQDAPRMIVADSGPVKVAPTNPGGTQNPYTGLKIYQAPASPDDSEAEGSTPPPTPNGKTADAAPVISPSLAPVIRPTQGDATPKPAATPAVTPPVTAAAAPPPVVTPKVITPKVVAAKPAPAKPTVVATAAPANDNSDVATKPPAKLSPLVSQPATKPAVVTPPPAAEAKPAPAEITPAPAAEKPAATGSGFVLQIGAYKSEEEANAAWKSYQAKHPVVGGYESDIKKVDLGDKGTWYRLRLGSFGDKAAAGALCAKLKADGGDCIPSKQ